MLFCKINKFVILAATALIALSGNAQSFKLPKAHNAEHQGLIAKQENIGNQISVEETKAFVDNLFKEEEEPELDIYTEGWESKRVNAYAGMEVPDTKVIDVSNFAMPTPGYVTSPYGYRPRFKRVHKGIDLKLQTGDTVRAAFDGRVRLTNFERKGYGYYVIVRHPNGLETVYGHLSKFLVKPDQYVKAGGADSPWRQHRTQLRKPPPLRDPLYGLPDQPGSNLRLCQPDSPHRRVHF